jgi:hypothetical protein
MMLFLLAVSLIHSLPATAFQNEPDGFRGIKWGTNISELPDMRLAEDTGEEKYYQRMNDKMQIGDSELERIVYGFYKNRFFVAIVTCRDHTNFLKLKETLFQLYGRGYSPNPAVEKYYWLGNSVDVILDFKDVSLKGLIWFSYKPILEEEQRDMKNSGKRGAKDL